MQGFYYGISMGILGSLHCVGMCGPLVLRIHKGSRNFWQHSFFHIGKITAYVVIGFVFGLLSQSLHLFLSQQKLSIAVGLICILYFSVQFFTPTSSNSLSQITTKLSQWFFRFNTSSNKFSKFLLLGFGNGLLPCGLVYTAATTSVASGHIEMSVIFMVGFGLGTIPSLTLVQGLIQFIPIKVKFIWEILYRYLLLIIGILLILRGLNLGIPYISPAFDEEKEEVHSCCHKD